MQLKIVLFQIFGRNKVERRLSQVCKCYKLKPSSLQSYVLLDLYGQAANHTLCTYYDNKLTQYEVRHLYKETIWTQNNNFDKCLHILQFSCLHIEDH